MYSINYFTSFHRYPFINRDYLQWMENKNVRLIDVLDLQANIF